MTTIAIIGAGLAGLSCAKALIENGLPAMEVTVFDKSRGIGGRMATRYAGVYEFDHGAQYFTQSAEPFGTLLSELVSNGVVVPWPDKIVEIGGACAHDIARYVAAPRMNSLCKSMAEPFQLELARKISALTLTEDGWHLRDGTGAVYGPFDYVVSAMPVPQMLALMPRAFPDHKSSLDNVLMVGCFSLMLGFEMSVEMPWQAARIKGSPVGWIAVNSSKPGRDTGMSVLVQSSNDWAEAHLEDAPERVEAALLEAASDLAGVDLAGADHKALHRWRYAATPRPLGAPFLFDRNAQLAACGDWCLGSKVEAAFESGTALADALLAEINGRAV